MPELPEVETIRAELDNSVVGRQITAIEVLWPGSIANLTEDEFCKSICAKTITGVERRGKYLILRLGDSKVLIIHLRMSGAILTREAFAPEDPYTRLTLWLDYKLELRFCDRRKLGKLWLLDEKEAITAKLGFEPLSDNFNPHMLKTVFGKSKAPIKALLCDQKKIAGIGNMYADEILFQLGLHPLIRGDAIPAEKFKDMHRIIVNTLNAAIARGGASVDTFIHTDGKEGSAQSWFAVAHRKGKSCPGCGTTIERIRVRGRGSYYCPCCQPEPPGSSYAI